MKFLLDTNICIYIINQRPPGVVQRFREYRMGDIGVSSITAAELAFGIAKTGSARNQEALEMFLAPLEVVAFDDQCLWHYAHLRAGLEQRGEPIGPMDTLIAAHALALGSTLVTNNTREFKRVPGLKLDNWALTQDRG